MRIPSALWWFIPVLGIALAATSVRAAARPDSDPASTPLTVVLISGDTLHAACVEPAGIGMVRITEPGGRYEFRAANRVRRVLDGAGRDRTSDALDRGRVIGVRPVETFPGGRAPAASKPVRYGPRSVVRSFGITETSVFARVDKDPGRDERSYTFSFDLGREINVTERDAFGATVFLGVGNGSGDLGARLHYRRWLGLHSSLDFAPGLILSHEEPGRANGQGIGLVGQVAWSNSPWVSVAAQIYSVDRSDVTYYGWYDSVTVPGRRETGVMLGFKVGGTPGIVAGAAGAVIGLIVAGDPDHPVYSPTLTPLGP